MLCRRRYTRLLLSRLAFLALLLYAPDAAAVPYTADKPLELYLSPVIAPVRIVGMAGAHLAIAEGSGAQLGNPAAVANRLAYTNNTWYDWDFSFDYLGLGTGSGPIDTDVYNAGAAKINADEITTAILTLAFVWGRLGVGGAVAVDAYEACIGGGDCPQSRRFEQSSGTFALTLGYAFAEGDVVLGGQVRTLTASFVVGGDSSGSPPLENTIGATLGALWRPAGEPFRLGIAFASGIRARVQGPPGTSVAGLVLPQQLKTPWRLAVGGAYQFGTPFNTSPAFDTAVAPKHLPKPYHLLALDVVMVGPTKGSALDEWLAGEFQPVGRTINLAVHLGYETEFWPRRMRARLGSYWEPSRYQSVSGRPHFTAGFDLRLLKILWDWRFSTAIDLAPRYSNLVLSLGFWH